MCGIFGYVNTCDPIQKVIKGLKHLEYRGYDSSGIAGLFNGKLECVKAVGKVEELEKAIEERQLKLDIAIGHTRWATHGKPAKKNAHPHLDESRSLAVVHNGIIENHHELREMLEKEGVKFLSETDTEVIAHLISHFYNGDLIEALKKAIPLLHGSFAIGCIHKDYPGTLIGIAKDSPLVVGVGKGESFLSSDSQAFSEYTKEVFYLSDGEIAVIQKDKIEIYSSTLEIIKKETEILSDSVNIITKEGYAHYTLKEIFDQPQALKNCLLSRFSEEWGSAIFEELPFDPKEFLSINNILIVACGTSWHAGILGHYLLEGLARIPARVEFSSELRYQNPI
ncbi:MAG: isomerizing glutamine--fructose-6-phosphate transaminase, partial [Waddliaceae bacterium]